jgi:hypothetical protein
MSSSNIPTRLTIRLPGTSRQGIPCTLTTDKENIPVAALGGGDVISPRRSNISPAKVNDVFYGVQSPLHFAKLLNFHSLDPIVSPRRPSEFWLNNPAWIGTFLAS